MDPNSDPLTQPGDSTSSSLIQRAKKREPEAWQRLVDLYAPLILHWCGRCGLSAADANDILQEVFVAVSTSLDRFWHDRRSGTFRGWLWTITRNKIRDHFRKRAAAPQAAGGTDAQRLLANIPEQWDESADPRDRTALQNLYWRAADLIRHEFQERTWQAFWRSVVLGEKTADIAADLGISSNAVRQYKSRVLRRLRQELGDLKE